jgi:hypothetical protein
MKLCVYHGRLNLKTGGTDADGNESDDWGFEGPVLLNIKWQDYTYGCYYIGFRSPEAKAEAKRLTGWPDGVHEDDLEVQFEGDCIKIHNAERSRDEFFGDWMLWDDADVPK